MSAIGRRATVARSAALSAISIRRRNCLALAAACDARAHHCRPQRPARDVAFADFPLTYMTPAIARGRDPRTREIPALAGRPRLGVRGIRTPARRFRHRRRQPLSSIADAGMRIVRVSLTLAGLGPAPLRMHAVERTPLGKRASSGSVPRSQPKCAARAKPTAMSMPPADYRRHLAAVLSRRALELAHRRARPVAEPGEAPA